MYEIYGVKLSKSSLSVPGLLLKDGLMIEDADYCIKDINYSLLKIDNMETPTITAKRTKWILDAAHSEISFKVKHLMITNVKGGFRKFNAEVTTIGDDPATATVHAVIDTDSIYTNDDSRDKHLRSADFFDVENHEKIVFEGTSF